MGCRWHIGQGYPSKIWNLYSITPQAFPLPAFLLPKQPVPKEDTCSTGTVTDIYRIMILGPHKPNLFYVPWNLAPGTVCLRHSCRSSKKEEPWRAHMANM